MNVKHEHQRYSSRLACADGSFWLWRGKGKFVFLPIQPWQFISGHFGEGVVVQMHGFGVMFISEVSILNHPSHGSSAND